MILRLTAQDDKRGTTNPSSGRESRGVSDNDGGDHQAPRERGGDSWGVVCLVAARTKTRSGSAVKTLMVVASELVPLDGFPSHGDCDRVEVSGTFGIALISRSADDFTPHVLARSTRRGLPGCVLDDSCTAHH